MSTAVENAEPQAPKKKKPIYKRVWFWLAVIVVVIIIAAASGGGGSDGTVSGSPAQPSVSDGGDPASAPAPAEDSGTDAQAGQMVTVNSLGLTSAPLGEQEQFGSTYLCTRVTIVNSGKKSASFNPFDWKLQDPQGASRDATFGGTDTPLNSGDLAPGGNVTGDVCFDDPTGASGTYTVIYDPFLGDKATWKTERP